MKAELKEKWLAALRGGEYKQTRGKLRDNNVVEYVWTAEPDGREWTPPEGFVKPAYTSLFAYKETQGTIGHCCLGVLCDLLAKNDWQQEEWVDDDDVEPTILDEPDFEHDWHHSWDNGENLLSDYALAQVGLTEDQQNALAQLNDGGKSFSEIADFIESESILQFGPAF